MDDKCWTYARRLGHSTQTTRAAARKNSSHNGLDTPGGSVVKKRVWEAESMRLRGFFGSLILLAGFAVIGQAAQIKGVLIDKAFSSQVEVRLVPGPRLEGGMIVAEAHTREDALKPESQKGGYGVFTWDNKFYAFDEAGNRMALEALKASKKLDDLEVEINGEIQGDKIKVTSLKLL
jgi:hypothetical protein